MSTNLYVPLHQHSQISFLDGEASCEKIAQGAGDRGLDAAAITDHQEVAGHLMFQKACLAANVKPVFGLEGYLCDYNAVEAKAHKLRPSDYSHITLLAQNDEGLRNLWSWATVASTQNKYHKALMDWETMKPYTKGLWASDGCLLSYIAKAIIEGNEQRQHELMGRYLNAFGENFFVELHTWQFIDMPPEPDPDHPDNVLLARTYGHKSVRTMDRKDWDSNYERRKLNENMTMVNQRKVELANQYGVPLVVVNDNHYVDRADWVKHNLVWAMSTQQNDDKTGNGETAAWMMVDDELVHWMGKHGIAESVVREAISNSHMIGESCNVEIKSEPKMPRLTSSDRDDLTLFIDNIEKGFERKVVGRGLDEELYRQRMEDEARMIVRKGYPGYFNVVEDLVRHSRENLGIFTGPGRGSAGGSLIAWLQGITRMDPIKYDLLFERFISEDRTDFPDIDIDFQRSRIDEVKQYTADRYGADHVCGIGTFTRSAPLSILKDLGRSMGVGYADAQLISKSIGKVASGVTWDEMITAKADKIAPWVAKYPDLFMRAEQMVGMIRQSSVHASGWVISPIPLLGNIPLREKSGSVVTVFEQNEVEELGFLKFDLLAIRHMDTIKFALDMIEERHGEVIDFDEFGDAQYADPAIWEAVARGDCLGLFQLDADLMTQTAKRLKPQSERQVAELLAINRPGVIDAGLLTPYIERKHGREEVEFDHPMVEELLGETYGIMIYQEQMMKMARRVAGFTPTRAEYLRKVVGKKKVELIPGLKIEFYDGCHANAEFIAQCAGDPDKVIGKLWAGIEASGLYLFNKSHSVGYALIGTWEAWLKTYYYKEFITACLQTVDKDDQPRYVRHARNHDLEILPPDINVSNHHFTLTEEGVRYGLPSVRNVGAVAFADILRARPFTSIEHMLDKVTKAKVNKRVVVNLIRIGALDPMHPEMNRADMEELYYSLAKTPKATRETPPDYGNQLEMYRLEKELVGNHILYDPMRDYESLVERACLQSPEQIDDMESGELCMIGGLITKIKTHVTRQRDQMAFLGIMWREQEFDVVMFPDAYKAHKHFLTTDAPVVVRAIKTSKGGVHVTALERLDFISPTRNETHA